MNLVGIVVEFFGPWGGVASVAGLIVSLLTLFKVYSIAQARRREREDLKDVFFVYDLQIFIDETSEVLANLHERLLAGEELDSKKLARALFLRIGALNRASGALERALHALDILRDGEKTQIFRSYLAKSLSLADERKYDEAISYMKKEIGFQEELGTEAATLEIARCYLKMTLFDIARSRFRTAKDYARLSHRHALQVGGAREIEEEALGLTKLIDKRWNEQTVRKEKESAVLDSGDV